MRFIEINIKNYRAHRDTTVKFSPQLLVIGGRNESGKSTLAEAIHRVLFLKSDGTTDAHKRMKSDFGGEPEVTLRFEQGGKNYRLFKRFLKNQMTQFGAENEKVFTDDEAEEELSKAIKAKTAFGKSGLTSQWAHLWAWQESNMESPFGENLYPHQDLLTEMQRLGGGAAAMQSAKDQKLSKAFIAKRDQLYTGRGLQANSPAAKAQQRVEQHQEDVRKTKVVLEEIQDALKKIRESEESIIEANLLQAKIGIELQQSESELVAIESLENETTTVAKDLESAATNLHALNKDKKKIDETLGSNAELSAELAEAEKTLAPLAQDTAGCRAALTSANTTANAAYTERDKLQKSATLVQHSLDKIVHLEKQTELQCKLIEAQKIDAEITKFASRLAAIPKITRRDITALTKLTDAVNSAEATLVAMGVSVQVEKAGRNITIDGKSIPIGETVNLIGQTAIQVGDDVTLNLLPKNGDIASQQAKLEQATQDLQSEFRNYGIKSLDEAEKNLGARENIELDIKILTVRRGDISAVDLQNEAASLADEVIQHEAKYPETKDVKATAKPKLTTDKANLAPQVKKAQTEADTKGQLYIIAQQNLKQAEENERELSQKVTELKSEIQRNESQVMGMLNAHSDMAGLINKIALAKSKNETLTSQLNDIKASVSKLSPDQVRLAIKMKRKSLTDLSVAITEAQKASNTNRGGVSAKAKGDPKVAFESSVAKFEAATNDFNRENSLAEALRLLADTFEETQSELNKAFTGPLVTKINEYTAIIFGYEAKIDITQEEGTFSTPVLIRPQNGQSSTTTFDKLSGGAKEQFSAVIRLAMAEVLSQPHGGQLPVLFDDTFSYTDTDNLNKVHLMLNHATEKGLQVILFTHTPSLFKSMGADQTAL